MPGGVVGAHLRGKQADFSWHAGVFSRGIMEEFDDMDSGSAVVVGAKDGGKYSGWTWFGAVRLYF